MLGVKTPRASRPTGDEDLTPLLNALGPILDALR